jgi:hypothetical protein
MLWENVVAASEIFRESFHDFIGTFHSVLYVGLERL